MFVKNFIRDMSVPQTNTAPGTMATAGVFNGVDEYLSVYNPEVVGLFNNDEVNGANYMNTDPTSTEQWYLSIWYKPTAARNDNTDDKVLFHNGLAGNDAFKIFIPDNSTDIKCFIGDGDGNANKTLTVSSVAVVDQWHNVLIRSKQHGGGNRVFYIYHNSQFKGTAVMDDIYTNDNSDDHVTIGCYRPAIDGTAANFFVGQIAQATLVTGLVASSTWFYAYGVGFDWSLVNLGSNLLMDITMGDFTTSVSNMDGARDGADNLMIFDSSIASTKRRADKALGKIVEDDMAAGDWTRGAGWRVISSNLKRLPAGVSSNTTCVLDGFTPVVGRVYKVEYYFNVTTACGNENDTLTIAGSTISTSTSTGVKSGTVFIKAANTNKLTFTGGGDGSDTSAITVGTCRVWEYERYANMENMTLADNLTKTGPSKSRV